MTKESIIKDGISPLKTYYRLTKPGIIYGNLITAAAGFFLAAKSHVSLGLLLATLAGISLVIASACVFNNYIDRDIDARMARTKKRAFVRGSIKTAIALIYASLLGSAGVLILAIYTNLLAVLVALTGFFFYVVMYSIWKRRSSFGTIVGSISGAVPPVVGYTAVTDRLDSGALLLFLTLVFWQMPHFYAIAIYRLKDYRAAGIPVLPLQKGIRTTKFHMLIYISAFTTTAILMAVFGYTGWLYLMIASLFGLIWLSLAIKGFRAIDSQLWARKMFLFSLVVITVLCVTISLDSVLP